MEEQEYFEKLRACDPQLDDSEPSAATIALCDAAVQEHPDSARLWILRGDLLQLADFDTGHPLTESAHCYRQAITLAPHDPQAYEELGQFLKTVQGNPRKARQYLHKAKLLRRARHKHEHHEHQKSSDES